MTDTPTVEQLIEAWAHQECFNPICSGGCPERFPAMRAINKVKADALNEAAAEFGDTTWVDVLSGVTNDVEAVQAFTAWLKERAQQIAEGS